MQAPAAPARINPVTPIADAMMDSTPLVALTGQVSSLVLGKDARSRRPISPAYDKAITANNHLVKRIEDIAYAVKEAFHIAATVAGQARCWSISPKTHYRPRWCRIREIKLNLPGYKPNYNGNRKQIRAMRLLTEAEEADYVGQRRNDGRRDRRFSLHVSWPSAMGVPVVTTLHGIGSFPENHPQNIVACPACMAG
ncbi:MAG: hypothetical protein U0Z44_07165 [Kouleothrix sp.]